MSATLVRPENPVRPSRPAPPPEQRRGWYFAAVLVGAPVVNLCLAFIVLSAMSSYDAADGFWWFAVPLAVVADIWLLAPLSRRAGWGWTATVTGTAAAIALSFAYAVIAFLVFLSIACGGTNFCFS